MPPQVVPQSHFYHSRFILVRHWLLSAGDPEEGLWPHKDSERDSHALWGEEAPAGSEEEGNENCSTFLDLGTL